MISDVPAKRVESKGSLYPTKRLSIPELPPTVDDRIPALQFSSVMREDEFQVDKADNFARKHFGASFEVDASEENYNLIRMQLQELENKDRRIKQLEEDLEKSRAQSKTTLSSVVKEMCRHMENNLEACKLRLLEALDIYTPKDEVVAAEKLALQVAWYAAKEAGDAARRSEYKELNAPKDQIDSMFQFFYEELRLRWASSRCSYIMLDGVKSADYRELWNEQRKHLASLRDQLNATLKEVGERVVEEETLKGSLESLQNTMARNQKLYLRELLLKTERIRELDNKLAALTGHVAKPIPKLVDFDEELKGRQDTEEVVDEESLKKAQMEAEIDLLRRQVMERCQQASHMEAELAAQRKEIDMLRVELERKWEIEDSQDSHSEASGDHRGSIRSSASRRSDHLAGFSSRMRRSSTLRSGRSLGSHTSIPPRPSRSPKKTQKKKKKKKKKRKEENEEAGRAGKEEGVGGEQREAGNAGNKGKGGRSSRSPPRDTARKKHTRKTKKVKVKHIRAKTPSAGGATALSRRRSTLASVGTTCSMAYSVGQKVEVWCCEDEIDEWSKAVVVGMAGSHYRVKFKDGEEWSDVKPDEIRERDDLLSEGTPSSFESGGEGQSAEEEGSSEEEEEEEDEEEEEEEEEEGNPPYRMDSRLEHQLSTDGSRQQDRAAIQRLQKALADAEDRIRDQAKQLKTTQERLEELEARDQASNARRRMSNRATGLLTKPDAAQEILDLQDENYNLKKEVDRLEADVRRLERAGARDAAEKQTMRDGELEEALKKAEQLQNINAEFRNLNNILRDQLLQAHEEKAALQESLRLQEAYGLTPSLPLSPTSADSELAMSSAPTTPPPVTLEYDKDAMEPAAATQGTKEAKGPAAGPRQRTRESQGHQARASSGEPTAERDQLKDKMARMMREWHLEKQHTEAMKAELRRTKQQMRMTLEDTRSNILLLQETQRNLIADYRVFKEHHRNCSAAEGNPDDEIDRRLRGVRWAPGGTTQEVLRGIVIEDILVKNKTEEDVAPLEHLVLEALETERLRPEFLIHFLTPEQLTVLHQEAMSAAARVFAAGGDEMSGEVLKRLVETSAAILAKGGDIVAMFGERPFDFASTVPAESPQRTAVEEGVRSLFESAARQAGKHPNDTREPAGKGETLVTSPNTTAFTTPLKSALADTMPHTADTSACVEEGAPSPDVSVITPTPATSEAQDITTALNGATEEDVMAILRLPLDQVLEAAPQFEQLLKQMPFEVQSNIRSLWALGPASPPDLLLQAVAACFNSGLIPRSLVTGEPVNPSHHTPNVGNATAVGTTSPKKKTQPNSAPQHSTSASPPQHTTRDESEGEALPAINIRRTRDLSPPSIVSLPDHKRLRLEEIILSEFKGIEAALEYLDVFELFALLKLELLDLISIQEQSAEFNAAVARNSRPSEEKVAHQLEYDRLLLLEKFKLFRSIEMYTTLMLLKMRRRKESVLRNREEQLSRVLSAVGHISQTHPKEAELLMKVAREAYRHRGVQHDDWNTPLLVKLHDMDCDGGPALSLTPLGRQTLPSRSNSLQPLKRPHTTPSRSTDPDLPDVVHKGTTHIVRRTSMGIVGVVQGKVKPTWSLRARAKAAAAGATNPGHVV